MTEELFTLDNLPFSQRSPLVERRIAELVAALDAHGSATPSSLPVRRKRKKRRRKRTRRSCCPWRLLRFSSFSCLLQSWFEVWVSSELVEDIGFFRAALRTFFSTRPSFVSVLSGCRKLEFRMMTSWDVFVFFGGPIVDTCLFVRPSCVYVCFLWSCRSWRWFHDASGTHSLYTASEADHSWNLIVHTFTQDTILIYSSHEFNQIIMPTGKMSKLCRRLSYILNTWLSYSWFWTRALFFSAWCMIHRYFMIIESRSRFWVCSKIMTYLTFFSFDWRSSLVWILNRYESDFLSSRIALYNWIVPFWRARDFLVHSRYDSYIFISWI